MWSNSFNFKGIVRFIWSSFVYHDNHKLQYIMSRYNYHDIDIIAHQKYICRLNAFVT